MRSTADSKRAFVLKGFRTSLIRVVSGHVLQDTASVNSSCNTSVVCLNTVLGTGIMSPPVLFYCSVSVDG
jgi:hypothetical protein